MKRFTIILMVSAALCFGVSACGDKQEKVETSSKNVEAASSQEKNKEYLTEEQIAAMYSSPDDYKDKYVKITGEIFQEPETDDKGIYFQMWGDPSNSERNTLVGYNGKDITVKNGDYVIVDGYIKGAYEGENALGGKVNAPVIVAETVTVSTYKDTVSPTISEITPENATIDQNGMVMAIQKVEFAEKETRVYVTAENKTNTKSYIYTYSTKVTQDGAQFEQESNFNADYEELQSELLSGIKSSGVLVFPVIDSKKGFSNIYRR